jgi:hypothetical protein
LTVAKNGSSADAIRGTTTRLSVNAAMLVMPRIDRHSYRM